MIPERTIEAINWYVQERIRPGDFLLAVLENNLAEAINRADPENLQCLPEIVNSLFWDVPVVC